MLTEVKYTTTKLNFLILNSKKIKMWLPNSLNDDMSNCFHILVAFGGVWIDSSRVRIEG